MKLCVLDFDHTWVHQNCSGLSKCLDEKPPKFSRVAQPGTSFAKSEEVGSGELGTRRPLGLAVRREIESVDVGKQECHVR